MLTSILRIHQLLESVLTFSPYFFSLSSLSGVKIEEFYKLSNLSIITFGDPILC